MCRGLDLVCKAPGAPPWLSSGSIPPGIEFGGVGRVSGVDLGSLQIQVVNCLLEQAVGASALCHFGAGKHGGGGGPTRPVALPKIAPGGLAYPRGLEPMLESECDGSTVDAALGKECGACAGFEGQIAEGNGGCVTAADHRDVLAGRGCWRDRGAR